MSTRTHPAHTWHIPGTHLAYTRHTPGTHSAYTRHTPGIHPAHTRHTPGTHPAYRGYYRSFCPLIQERSVQDTLPLLPLKISMHLVRLLQLLTGQPPLVECLSHICSHLLVSDVNDIKLVTATSVLESSIVAFDGETKDL